MNRYRSLLSTFITFDHLITLNMPSVNAVNVCPTLIIDSIASDYYDKNGTSRIECYIS